MTRVVILIGLAACSSDKKPTGVDAKQIDASTFACTCNATTDFCFHYSAGIAPTNGCNALPTGCSTCDCLLPMITCSGTPSCSVVEGLVTVTCAAP